MRLPHSEITIRALKDVEFRRRMQNNPRRTIASTFDVQIPERVTVKVVEDNPDLVHLILPARPGDRGEEVGVIAVTLDRMRRDPTFKASVIKDPQGVFGQITGVALPDRPKVAVLEDTRDLVHIHLPLDSRDEDFNVDPEILTTEVYGGGETYGGPLPTTEGPECTSLAGNNSSMVQCCNTDIVNTVSAWDCCPDDEPTDDPGDIITF